MAPAIEGKPCAAGPADDLAFLDQYEIRQAGGQTILEYWIPADDLPESSENMVGTIESPATASPRA